MPAEGNERFARATPVVVDDADTCQTDHIGSIGDLDCFRFETPGSGDYLLVVKAAESQKNTAQAPHTVSLEVLDIDDPPEVQTDGNNTPGAADTLISGVTANGKIAFRGDEDWYRNDVDTSTPKVLELFLDTAAAGQVEYYLSLMRDGVIKKTHDVDGSDGATEMCQR